MMVENEIASRRADLSVEKRALLEKRLHGDRNGTSRPAIIPRRTESTGAALSFAQERLWFLDQLAPSSPLYTMPFALRLEGRLDQRALEKSISAIVRRHTMLRTQFVATGGGPMQIVGAETAVDVPVVDLGGQLTGDRDAALKRLLTEEAELPFDLASDLMLRAKLFRLKEQEHVLFLNMHHIASDGWSWAIFFRELAEFYDAFRGGRPASVPELPIQYADFSGWQQERLHGEVFEKQLAYWKQQLAGAPVLLELPTDHPRPPAQTFHGAQQSLKLSRPLADSFKEIGRQEGATLYMTMLSAFQVLLHRYTRQEDILVGCPVAGRTHSELESLIGFFVNTLALRTDLSGDPTFLALLRRVREVMLDATAHQELPFEKLVEEIRPIRSGSFPPLIQTMFVLQNAPTLNLELAELEITPVAVDNGTAKFDLTFFVEESDQGLNLTAEYNRDLFDPATIVRMLRHYATLLEEIVSNPGQKISHLALLPRGEREQLLVEWNKTATDYPKDKTIAQMFEEQATKIPDGVALVFNSHQLTYRDLNERANQLAHHLSKHGVGPGVMVGICLERSAEMIVALLAIAKAGGAYVSLDPAYPKERLTMMLEDAQLQVLLTQETLRDVLRLETHNPVMVCVDAIHDLIAQESVINPDVPTAAEQPAYVSFTSGSTGRPKGVCVPHRGVVRLVKETDYVHFGADEVFLQLAPIAFDASTFEIWGALLNGARLVVFPPQTPSLAELGEFIRANRITTVWLTAGLFHQMVDEQLESLRTVRQLLAGGDVLSVPHVQKALEHLPGIRLINGYGPTENTTFTCCHRITSPVASDRSIPIGRPIANTQVYVLDDQWQPVPIGVPGELYVGGAGLALGYVNQPAVTEEKFVANPFCNEPGARLYRTGDLVRWLADGNIEFLGRLDSQVKIRGFRVEVGEIETALAQHPAVKECAAVIRESVSNEKQLVAYLVVNLSSAPAVSELRNFLRARVPEYMLPSAFVFLEALPLSANGKVDRNVLPPLEQTRTPSEKQFVIPRDEIEKALANLWEDLLGIRPIGLTDNFFELGGHSLMAVRHIAQIEHAFGRKLPVAAIFQSPTIGQLAQLLRDEKSRRSVVESSVVEIQPRGTKPPVFLVHGVGGGMFWGYTNLSRHLGPDQPVYAFKSRGMDGGEEFATVEEMAAQYVTDLRTFQPKGPYQLGGYCFGGNVAFEMARQLAAKGERVALLALINCIPPNSNYIRIRITPATVLKLFGNLAYWAGYILRLKPCQQRDLLQWKFRAIKKRLRRFIKRQRVTVANFDAEEVVDLSAQPEDRRKLWQTHVTVLFKHHPQLYAGHITLFRTRGHSLLCSFDDAYGWNEYAAGGVSVRVVSGAHESILDEPHVQALAKVMAQCLQENHLKQSEDHLP